MGSCRALEERLRLLAVAFLGGLLALLGLCSALLLPSFFASQLFYGHRPMLVSIGGWTVMALGVAQVVRLGSGSRRIAQAAGARRSGSAVFAFALGAVSWPAGFFWLGADPWAASSPWLRWAVTPSTAVHCSRTRPALGTIQLKSPRSSR